MPTRRRLAGQALMFRLGLPSCSTAPLAQKRGPRPASETLFQTLFAQALSQETGNIDGLLRPLFRIFRHDGLKKLIYRGGKIRVALSGDGTGSRTCAMAIFIAPLTWNGRPPVSISKHMTPKE